MHPPKYLNRNQAAKHCTEQGCPTAPTTLAKLATVGGGPQYVKWGRTPLYTQEGLDRWIQEKLGRPRRSSSDQGKAA
jgi:hypothetical protein